MFASTHERCAGAATKAAGPLRVSWPSRRPESLGL